MKRDLDLARKIMFKIEESEHPAPTDMSIEGYSAEQINFHVDLLRKAELLEATSVAGLGFNDDILNWRITGLTWNGYEFLEASRNETSWKEAMDTVITQVGGSVFVLLLQALIQKGKEKLGIP